MTINVLAIGDTGNILLTISQYVKKSKIHVVNFQQDGMGTYTYGKYNDMFEGYKVMDHIRKINEIKQQYDLCITMNAGERIAYLADLNYISFYVGRDIDAPKFIKNSKEEWFDEPLHKLNFFERIFYRNAFEYAIAHLAYTWVFEHLKKYTKNGIKMDMVPIDRSLFQKNVTPINREKTKFTFFSPQRMGKPKGTDLIWDALKYCKTDFEILQVEWFDESTEEELKIKEELIRNKPKQVKFIPKIKREDMAKYYSFSDGVLGNMRIGTYALVELEAVFCGKPVLQFTNQKFEIYADEEKIQSPFLPFSNEPTEIAKVIDRLVTSEEFRTKIQKDELEFALKISDPEKVAAWWDDFFEKIAKNYPSITKKSSKIRISLRIWFFLFANRLYWKKIRNYFRKK